MVREQTLTPRSSTGFPGSEGARRATGDPGKPETAVDGDSTDTQVKQKPIRRRLTVPYKLKVLQRVAELKAEGNGSIGAYLRAEGVYYSMVRRWQREAEEGKLGAPKPFRKQKSRESLLKENKTLKRKLEKLEKNLAKKELIIELQKKISDIMDIETQSSNENRKRWN